MSTEILNALKAETILNGTTILGQTQNLNSTLKYKTDKNSYSFEDYFHILNAELQGIERIELSPVIPPGGAQSYLAELSTALQLITDKIESAHTKAIYFEGKLKSAAHLRDNLQATFSAWYLIAISERLKFYDIKLPASTQRALAESEFSRLVGDEDLNIDGLISAVEVMIVHLKEMKKIANEKYKLGADQANASITNLPFNGVSEGSQFSLLKQRWDMKSEIKSDPEYDDIITEEEPAYIQKQERQHTEIPEGIHKIISSPSVLFDDEVTAEDLETKAQEWREQVERTAEGAYSKAEDMFRSLSEEELAKVNPITEEEVHQALEEGARDVAIATGKTVIIEDSFAGTVKITDTKAELVPLKKRTISFDDEDDMEVISESKPAKKPVIEEVISPKKKKVISFDDEDIDFGMAIPEPKSPVSRKKIDFDAEESPF